MQPFSFLEISLKPKNNQGQRTMAEIVVSASKGSIDPLLAKLNDLVEDNLTGLCELDIVFLRDELRSMNALLNKLEEDTDELDPQVKDWRNQVREMAYDVEDCLDKFMHRVDCVDAKAGLVRRVSYFLKTMRARLETAKHIKELKTRLEEISDRRKRYKHKGHMPSSSPVTVDPRICALYNDAANLVGIEGPREEFIKLLTKPEEQLKVMSILGFGGLGKTTLAKEVYNRIGGQFSCKAFVSVSQKPDMKRLLDHVQSKFRIAGCSAACEVQDIIDNIRRYLKQRRYLIVVDDLWDASSWDIISSAFPQNGNGSRIIVTTRVEHVASKACCNHHECIFRMRPLSTQHSRQLFCKRIFGTEDGCPSHFREVSAEILKKCGGLPLAIITIASLLASKPTRLKKEWESIRNSIGVQFGANPTLEGMRQILHLSFKNLPRHLRACLLYLGMFPEDHVIARDDLIRQWVAEGFVSHSHGKDLEDAAKSYFNELVNRSLIQLESSDDTEGIVSCRVHDMMLDLILSKCADNNFLSVAYNVENIERQHDYKVRRLSMDFRAAGAVPENGTMSLTNANILKQVRSLALFAKSMCMPPSLSLFECLRVLVFESPSMIKVDLTPIDQLFQLRYLKVAGDASAIIELPTEIRGLRYLETLELHSTCIRNMPSDVVHLPRLIHLIILPYTMLPDGIGNMKSLHTLRNFDMSETEKVKALGMLTNLMSLGLFTVSLPTATEIEALVTSLGKLLNIRYLDLRLCGQMYKDIANCLDSLSHAPLQLERLNLAGWQLPRVPRWICRDLGNLSHLNLLMKETSTDAISVLAELPSLTILYLKVVDSPKEDATIMFGMGFPALEQLYFCCGRDTPSHLSFLPGMVLPKLRHLEIYFDEWEWGGAPPAGMDHLLGLRSVEVYMSFHCSEGGHSSSYRRATDSRAGCVFAGATKVHPNRPAFSMHYIPLTRGASPPLFVW